MNSRKLVLAASIIWGTSLSLSLADSRGANAPKPLILERGPNHRVVRHVSWQTNNVGQVSVRTNNYTEIATGLHYQENGVWKEAKEEIEILPGGAGAVARQGGHKVIFAPNLNTPGVIDLETPDGQRLRSHVLGLGYYDPTSGRSEIIAEVKNSEGELVGKNQVVYRDAFDGVAADVRYTYRKSGFEQDVILRSSPPAPEKFGLNPKTTRLEVFTEFLNPASPVKTERAVSGTSLRDEKLTFGQMSLGPGRAFPLAGGNKSKSSVPTGKTWINYEGRTILLEEVEYQTVEKHLKKLPGGKKSAQLKAKTANKLLADGRKIPGKLMAARPSSAKPMRLASLSPKEAGFVLDYVAVVEWEETEAVFESGQTYFISAGFWPYTLTIQAGAVVKFADDPISMGWGHTLAGNGVLICPSSGFATLTSMHDDTIGEIIDDSTGQPDLDVAAIYLELANGPARIHNLHFKYALAGMITGGSDTDNQIRDCLFVDCRSGVLGYGAVALTNVSFSDCANLVDYAWLGSYLGTCDVKLAHVQADTGGTVLAFDPEADLSDVALRLHKCCLPQESEINALGAAITTAGGTFSWSLCDPNDADYDDLPDAWEVQQFGGLSQRGTDDYDGDGISNYDEYVAESDPNTINFTARFDNLYVSNRTVTGLCEVSNGVPYQMTVLINSTNLATATWSNYQSSFTFTLPDLDGDHDVLVALRGRVTTNAPVQDFTELTLDRVPPVLAITNPILVSAAATVIKPYLQLQGYADETLSTYSYDLTNEFGLVTNQLVCVVDQAFDTNQFDFTTNYFQAFDIPLATNGNTITLRVSDLAGNVTTTNIDVVLDYSLATNAPVLALLWPTNDMQISGESFYIRGKINDETATLVAQQVDVNDVTNTVPGIVERNGMFWVENLPLVAGNNEWTIIATDAAGNVSSTNLTVTKSTVTVAITSTPTGDALYAPSGTVSGTVSDASYTVTVNGVAATVDGSGNWTAENVPNYGQGTVTYDAAAMPSGGEGGGSGTGVSAEVEQLPIVKITKHSSSVTEEVTAENVHAILSKTRDYRETGADGAHYQGKASVFSASGPYGTSLTEYEWSDADPVGTYHTTSSMGADYSGPMVPEDGENKVYPQQSLDHMITGDTSGSSSYYVTHYFAKGVRHEWLGGTTVQEVRATGRTEETLYTGGKARIARENLFGLTAVATEYYGRPSAHPWFYTLSRDVPGPAMQVAGKTLGADSLAYVVLPDNTPVDVTVKIKGAKHYSAGAAESKHVMRIRANGALLEADKIVAGANFCVGQKMTFQPVWNSVPDGVDEEKTTYQWKLSGNYVNDASQPCPTCSVDWINNPQRLKNQTTLAWWTSGAPGWPGKEYTAELKVNLVFLNGQKAEYSANGRFTMHRPDLGNYNTTVIKPTLDYHNGVIIRPNPGMFFAVQIFSCYSGEARVTQMIQGKAYNSKETIQSAKYAPDRRVFYRDLLFRVTGHQTYPDILRPDENLVSIDDAPTVPCDGFTSMHWDFKDYIRFKPDGDDENIFVTLGMFEWYMYGDTEPGTDPATGTVDYVPFPPAPPAPQFPRRLRDPANAHLDDKAKDSEEFPKWTYIFTF